MYAALTCEHGSFGRDATSARPLMTLACACRQVIGCHKTLSCRCKHCVAGQEDSDFGEQAGIYMLSASQNLIENHVFGMESSCRSGVYSEEAS